MFFSCQVAVPIQLIVLQPTIDIIKQYTNLPASIMDDMTDIIDNPDNGMLLERTMHFDFNSCMWCLHPTVWLSFYR
jgi:hypothetical protein